MRNGIVLILTAMIIVSGCARGQEEPSLTALNREEISGARLWERITVESDYTGYGQWEDHEGIKPGQSPHGLWHIVYVNRPLLSAVPLDSPAAPAGTIIVKENLNAEKVVEKITVMAKVDGYSPDTNDWFWAAYDPDGKVLAEGSPAGCVSCHAGMKSNDYIIIHPIQSR